MPERSRLIEMGWRTYAERVVPRDAGRTQVQECRRAFYGGAAHLLAALADVGEDDVSEAEGVARLESAGQEIQQFVNDVLGGRK